MHVEKSTEQLNMKFMFSKESQKNNNDMTKKDAIKLGAIVSIFFLFIGTLNASHSTVVQGTPANNLVSSILHEQKDIQLSSPLLTKDLPNLFKYSLTDSEGHRHISLEPYLKLMKKLAVEEKELLDNNTTFSINKFDKIMVNNYILNDEFYFKGILILKDNIPAPTLMHIIKSHFFLTKGYNELSKDIYNQVEQELLASDNIHQIHIAMTQLDLDSETKLKYAHRLEKLITINMKKGNDTWHKYIEENESAVLYLQKNYFEKKASRVYDKILEDTYKVQRPISDNSALDYELMENYKEKILDID